QCGAEGGVCVNCQLIGFNFDVTCINGTCTCPAPKSKRSSGGVSAQTLGECCVNHTDCDACEVCTDGACAAKTCPSGTTCNPATGQCGCARDSDCGNCNRCVSGVCSSGCGSFVPCCTDGACCPSP